MTHLLAIYGTVKISLILLLYLQYECSFKYSCHHLTLILVEERRLRVFENRVLRRIFGPKRDKVTGEWRILYNIGIFVTCNWVDTRCQ
jgi:hypothetical protein